jgi:hypothetical protein
MFRAMLVSWFAIALIVACGDIDAPPPDGSTTVLRPFPNAPAIVQQRQPLPFCGEEHVRQGPGANVPARDCFWSAYQVRRPAEFISTVTSTEGDPITYVYRVLPGGAVEVFVDSTQDAFSNRTWLRLACRTLALTDDRPDVLEFGADDCDEVTLR